MVLNTMPDYKFALNFSCLDNWIVRFIRVTHQSTERWPKEHLSLPVEKTRRPQTRACRRKHIGRMQIAKSTEAKVMKTMEKTTMSMQELSSQMGISLPKTYELVKTPGFPSIRIGKKIIIPIDVFWEWLVSTSSKEEWAPQKYGRKEVTLETIWEFVDRI